MANDYINIPTIELDDLPAKAAAAAADLLLLGSGGTGYKLTAEALAEYVLASYAPAVAGREQDIISAVNQVYSSVLGLASKTDIGNIQIANNMTELLSTTADKVLVLSDDSNYGNGGICWFENQGSRRNSLGYVRNDGSRVYPMPKTAPEPTNPPRRQIIGYVKSWVGRTNIIHSDNSQIDNTSLFGPDCEVDANGYFHNNCSDFVGAVLLGISYERSRYVRGKTSFNVCDTKFTQYRIPQSVESQKAIGGLSTREWAQWFAENGRLYKSPKTAEEFASILQFGDVIFFTSESAPDAVGSYYALSHCAICLGVVIASIAMDAPEQYGHPYVILAQSTADTSGGNEGVANQIRAYDLVNWINIFQVFARPDYMHNETFSPKIKDGKLILNDQDLDFLPAAEAMLDDLTSFKSIANQIYYSERWTTSVNFIPVIPSSIVTYTGIRSAARCSYNIRVLEYDQYYNKTVRGSTLVYQGGNPIAVTLSSNTKYVRFSLGVQSGYKIWLHDTDGFEVSIAPPGA